jgi:hypothetical protein
MRQDLLDDVRPLDEGEDAHPAGTAGAGENVVVIDDLKRRNS